MAIKLQIEFIGLLNSHHNRTKTIFRPRLIYKALIKSISFKI